MSFFGTKTGIPTILGQGTPSFRKQFNGNVFVVERTSRGRQEGGGGGTTTMTRSDIDEAGSASRADLTVFKQAAGNEIARLQLAMQKDDQRPRLRQPPQGGVRPARPAPEPAASNRISAVPW